MIGSILEPTVKLAEELKAFFLPEIKVLGLDLKELKQDLRQLKLKFTQIEGKLFGLEKVSHQTQADIKILTGKIAENEDKSKKLQTAIHNQEQEIQ